MPYRPDAEEQVKGLDNLFYEIQQLLYTNLPVIGDRVVDNALLESRLVHVRTLIDVFAHSERDNDDVLAAHYGFPVSPITLDSGYFERLNKDLAHLTYSRTRRSASNKGWPTKLVVVPILRRCKEFVDHILAHRATFHDIDPVAWRRLGMEIDAFLDSPAARYGV
jgi:hypothetical protein